MQKLLLLGAEAIAQGAIDGGISGIYAYPGTPSTEISLYIQNNTEALDKNIYCKWSTNEKTAMEAALGMSFAGKRAIVAMKHVGLNVAADPFINSALTGINGGLVIAVADDPSMHSSQNEQDSRFYGKFSMLPVFEPSSQQEAYEMTKFAFSFSESTGYPVLLRITTRLAHSRSGVVRSGIQPQNNISFIKDSNQFILLPAISRQRFKVLLNAQEKMLAEANKSPFNYFSSGKGERTAIVACGIAINYLDEFYPNYQYPFPVVKISQYPLPTGLLSNLSGLCDRIIVLEDGYPFVEEQLLVFFRNDIEISGRLDGTLPRDGELNPDSVAVAIGLKEEITQTHSTLTARPPGFCKGCGHIDMYNALNEVLKNYNENKVFADIGCYTLGALSPFNAIDSTLEMGASITMAKGAADAGVFPSIAVIGDSTFAHSGITGLLDCINENTSVTVVIADNSSVAMTGGQNSAAFGKIKNICLGLGISPEHVFEIEAFPTKLNEITTVLEKEINYKGTSVIIVQRECVQTVLRKNKIEARDKYNIIF